MQLSKIQWRPSTTATCAKQRTCLTWHSCKAAAACAATGCAVASTPASAALPCRSCSSSCCSCSAAVPSVAWQRFSSACDSPAAAAVPATPRNWRT